MPAPYSTPAEIDDYSHIDNDTLVPSVKFDVAEKTAAIAKADARIDYILKDWENYYVAPVLANVQSIVNEVSVYYSLYILFDKKAKIVMLMIPDANNFSTGDLNASTPDSEKKSFYLHYQALSQIYKIKAEELLTLVVPPGSDSIRSIFDFKLSDAMED